MKKSIKTIVLALATIGMLTGCFGEASTSNKTSNNSQSNVSSDNSSSNISTDTSITSSSTSTSTTSSATSSTTSSAPTSSSSSSSTSSIVIKTQITLSAPKTTLEINEEVLISSNVEGVTLSTTEGATITNGVFKATKDGTFVVIAHKDGDFIDGEITITVLPAKEDIVLSAVKTTLDLNESVTITSNIEGVTLSTTEGATIVNNVFTATKEGTYVVTGTKEGRYNAGTLTISVAFARTEAKVKSALNVLKAGQNYTLKAHSLLSDFDIYRTQDYFLDTELEEGMALFTNIIPNTDYERVAHYIKMVDNKLVIGGDVVYSNGVIATDLYDADGFYYVDIDKVEFEEHNGKFVTTDDTLLSSFATVLGSKMIYFAAAVQYSFNENYELVANILLTGENGGIDYESASMFGDLTYTNVGTTVAPILEEQYKAVTVANEGMSEEVASSFMLKQGHIKATVKEITDSEEKLVGISEYNFDEKYLIDYKLNNLTNQVTRNFFINDNGYAEYVGVGPDNQVATSYYGEWDTFTFPFATLDTTQFRKTAEHTYTYLGFATNKTADNLGWTSVSDYPFSYINAYEENGKIVSFTCESANNFVDASEEKDGSENVLHKYVMEIEVLPYETIEDPKPFEADADTTRVQAYLNEINGANANFTMFLGDRADTKEWKTIKVTENTILVQQYKDSATTYYGYHRLDDGTVVKFSALNENNVANARYEGDVELAEGKTFASLLGMDTAPETMKFDADGNIVFKDNVFGAGEALFNEFKYNRSAKDGTIKFDIGSGHIATITYTYGAGANSVEYASLYTGTFGTTAFTSTFEQSLLEVLPTIKEAPHPTSWAEEMPEFYNNIVSMIGEENMALIPYIYNVDYSGKYTIGFNTAAIKSVNLSGVEHSTEYRTAIADACVALGFTKNPNNQYSCYIVLGNMKLTVGTTGSAFSVMYKAA